MTSQCCDFTDRFLLPVAVGVPKVDLVEAVPVSSDHFVGDLRED